MQSQENIFYERLSRLIRLSGKSFNEVERELRYPRNALNGYKTGKIPSADRLLELAAYFEVTPEYLIGVNAKLGKRVQKSIKAIFDGFDGEQRKEMLQYCHEWFLNSI